MNQLVITGASRGLGRAIAREWAQYPGSRLVLTGRDSVALSEVADLAQSHGAKTSIVTGDLSTRESAAACADELGARTDPGAVLVSNAGVWPARKHLSDDGLESAFVVNVLAPLIVVRHMLDAGVIGRVLVIGAGLMVKGRFDLERTPQGADFSSWRTYCSTKLALAVAMRDLGEKTPDLPVDVIHPGVIKTGLGDRGGLLGAMLRLAKRRWEAPATTARRLIAWLASDAGTPGEPRWVFEDHVDPWPSVCDDPVLRQSVNSAVARYLGTDR